MTKTLKQATPFMFCNVIYNTKLSYMLILDLIKGNPVQSITYQTPKTQPK